MKPLNRTYSKGVAARCVPGGSSGNLSGALGGAWGSLGFARRAVEDPRGILGDQLLPTGSLAESVVLSMNAYIWSLGASQARPAAHIGLGDLKNLKKPSHLGSKSKPF